MRRTSTLIHNICKTKKTNIKKNLMYNYTD